MPTTCRCWIGADAFVEQYGLDLAEEPEARNVEPDPDCVTNPILELNLAEEQIASVVWATGYTLDYSWLKSRCLRPGRSPRSPSRRFDRSRNLLPRSPLVDSAGVIVHLRRLARRQVSGRPHRQPA